MFLGVKVKSTEEIVSVGTVYTVPFRQNNKVRDFFTERGQWTLSLLPCYGYSKRDDIQTRYSVLNDNCVSGFFTDKRKVDTVPS